MLRHTSEKKMIIKYVNTKVVKQFGGSGHVILPKDLIGRIVRITMAEEK
jgi:putative transposon-encoded protein